MTNRSVAAAAALGVLMSALAGTPVQAGPPGKDARSDGASIPTSVCRASGTLEARSLPARVPVDQCPLVGRTIRDHGARIAVPPPGQGRYAELLTTSGVEELRVETSRRGVVRLSSVGSETAGSSHEHEPVTASPRGAAAPSPQDHSATASPQTTAEPPPNDPFGTATVIGSLPFVEQVSAAGATLEDGEPQPKCGDALGTVWYRFRPGSTGWIEVEPTGSWDTVVAMYKGSSLGSLQQVLCTPSGPKKFQATGGTTYYFQVGRTSSSDLAGLRVRKTISPWEPCQDCAPPCSAGANSLLGFKWRKAWAWRFSNAPVASGLTRKAALAAIKRGIGTVPASTNDCGLADKVSARASYKGGTGTRPTGFICMPDGANVVGFGRLGTGVLGYACYTYNFTRGLNTAIEADITLSRSPGLWTTQPTRRSCSNRFDLQSTVAHEAGHAFGLDHSAGGNLTMYWTGAPCTPAGRTFGLGDVRGLRKLY